MYVVGPCCFLIPALRPGRLQRPVPNPGAISLKLIYSPTSPFVRKCMVVAAELGLTDRLEKVSGTANPVNRDASIVAVNPLGQVPTLITDDGHAIHDSRVICEYLNALGNGSFFPASGNARWEALTNQSMADGMLDAALLGRYEMGLRPEEYRWADWVSGQVDKINKGLDMFEKSIGQIGDRLDIGTVTLGCTLGYLDFRYPDLGWREGHPALARWYETFSQRPSMQESAPPQG